MIGAASGRSSRRYRKLVANLRAKRRPCVICGKSIDYTLKYPHRMSFSAHHLKPFATHPELREDPDNLDASHLRCNQGAIAIEDGHLPFDALPLGPRSREW